MKAHLFTYYLSILEGYFTKDMSHMGLGARKPVFRVSDQVRLKPVCSATQTSKHIEILLVASDHFTVQILNNKCSDQTVQMSWLVCAFFLTCTKVRFS